MTACGNGCIDHAEPYGTRVEVPVMAGSELVGAISAEWPEPPDSLCDTDMALLGVVGNLIQIAPKESGEETDGSTSCTTARRSS